MKSLLIISLALLVTNSHVSAIVANCSDKSPPNGSYMKTCNQIDYQRSYNDMDVSVCVLSAWCLNSKNQFIFTKKSGPVGTFPDMCIDIKNQDGHLECVK
mgnify:FL=1